MKQRAYHWTAIASLIALIMLCLAWELMLAPIRPGGSFLALKAVLLLLPLRGILKERVYTYQWSSMFILLFFTEGVMRGWADKGLSRDLALAEATLSTLFFLAVLGYIRERRRAQLSSSAR
ncbi:DUF2069 domain-containing protein [Paludibacterium paludis]|uniref:Membrane protein n=1 Tax=Paludibacterium paludis TaxID=1225769 RepID=A0A918U9B6_9NEIS|nr:DUF2069 domain-containing protein [Paludibacterium paludis]GGY15361.1 membrane protein [Paludibacterium paludis]